MSLTLNIVRSAWFLASCITSVAGLHFGATINFVQNFKTTTFKDFVAKYNRSYLEGSTEWSRREEIFKVRQQEVIQFHSKPRSWSMGITRFMDYTEQEYRSMLGYKGLGSRGQAHMMFELFNFAHANMEVPSEFAVASGKLGSLVRDQGACGSCWAEAATSVLEGHMEQNQILMANLSEFQNQTYASSGSPYTILSSQTIVSCTENKQHCGGAGGCSGATVELAYEMVKARGLPLSAGFPYFSGAGVSGSCSDRNFAQAVLGITNYEMLPSNAFEPLMQALYSSGGPIAASVDATNWNYYESGIFTDLDFGDGDFTVNHAVTLVAYKKPSPHNKGYWRIKNSWGTLWGEKGYIRVEMKDDEANHCGIDYDTHAGLACDGDPDTARVCGTCGILYDSVYPVGLFFRDYK